MRPISSLKPFVVICAMHDSPCRHPPNGGVAEFDIPSAFFRNCLCGHFQSQVLSGFDVFGMDFAI
jgi:hypothetical protein